MKTWSSIFADDGESDEIIGHADEFDPLEDFSRDDLIEIRVCEAKELKADMLPSLKRLGIPDARVVIVDLETSPFIEICGFCLTAEEVSELIRRLDPTWEGQACERSWGRLSGLPKLPKRSPPPDKLPRPASAKKPPNLMKPEPPKPPKPPKQETAGAPKPPERKQPPAPRRRRKLGGFPRRRNEKG